MLLLTGLIATSQAVLIDNFESYTEAGNIAADTGGVWNGLPSYTGNPDIGGEGTGNQYLTNFATTTARGAYCTLGSETVADGYIATLTFDVLIETAAQDTSFGLAGQGGTTENWNDYEAYIGVKNGAVFGRNAGTIEDLGVTLNVGQWYTVEIVANTSADTYDIYLDVMQIADDLVFRNSGGGAIVRDLDALKIYSNTVYTSSDLVRFDNIYLTSVVPEPMSLACWGSVVYFCGKGNK